MQIKNYQFIDLNYLDEVAGGDETTRATLLDLIAREILETVPQLSRLYSEGGWAEIKDHVHRLKTTTAFAGNPDLKNANEQIWRTLVAMENPETINGPIGAMTAVFQQVAGELQEERERMTPG